MTNAMRLATLCAALMCAATSARADVSPVSVCSPVTVAAVHALPSPGEEPFRVNQRLALIQDGAVPCMHWASLEIASCAFRTDLADASGHWLEDKDGRRFAQVGQLLTRDGAPGGPYVIGARVQGDKAPCVGASGHDTAGVPAGEELGGACVRETMGSPSNATGRPLMNFATIPVCTSSNPHPDGAQLQSSQNGVYCYIGQGAGLNDSNGRERDQSGTYLRGNAFCHVGFNSGYEVPAAKRPGVKAGWPKKVDTASPIVWRPYATGVKIAN
jgi:hypothetical protein